MDSMLYRFLRPLIKLVTNIFIRPKYKGLENIPETGKIILAGTHTNILDCFLLISSTKRSVHFLAKDDLWKGPKKILFAHMGLIPVNRKAKDPSSLKKAEEYLQAEQLIGIFPEGTTEKNRGLLPFKIGAVKMAYDTSSNIIPFVIKGKYKLFSKNLIIKFGKPITVTETNLELANENLRNIIIKMLEEDDLEMINNDQ